MARILAKVFLWLCLGLLLELSESNLVRFQNGKEYVYHYEATNQLEALGVIKTKAKFGVYLLEDIDKGQHCRLHVINIIQYVEHQSEEGEVHPHSRDWDMTHWFSFVMSPHGEIDTVYYPADENMEVLTMKKMLVGLFTSKMHVTDEVLASGKEWSYEVSEMGHEGKHKSTYTGTPTAEGYVFRRHKHGHIVPNAEASNQKEILYHSSLQLPHTIHIEESFSSPRSPPPEFDMFAGVPGDKKKKQEQEVHDYNLPEMAASSTGTLQFDYTRELPNNVTIVPPNNLINDSIEISMYSKPPVPLEEIDSLIAGNMTCFRKNIIESAERTSCFNNLVEMVSRLSAVNTTIVAERYILDDARTSIEIDNRNTMIDVLGAVATETTQLLLTEMILLSEKPNAEMIYRAMVHFVGLKKPPPKKFLDVLEEIGFNRKFAFPDKKNTSNVHHRALLVLGSVSKVLEKTDPKNAHRIVGELEDCLGVHDPYHHRHMRSVLSEEDYDNHLHYQANLIHALGNAGFDRSYDHFISYMNNTASPSLLRRCGILSVSRYKHEQAANTLLDMALNDHEEHVRYTATLEYQRHPHAMDFTHLMEEYQEVHTNQTHIHLDEGSNRPLVRNRREIFKDFHFELKLPFIDWSKTIGNNKIGASLGFVMKNFLTIDIKKFSGFLDVHVEDGAWARAHIGILGINQEFLNARLCFKGSGSYGLNILQEYGFDDIIEIVELYDEVVNEVVNSVKNTIKRFKNLLSLTKSNVNEIFDDFVETVEDLPNRVKDFRKIGRDLIKKIGEYNDLPDFITDVRNVVDRVNTLFHDIKTDVMKFYNAVVDGVKVTLPWAAQQIEDAIETAAKAIKKLFKSPQTAVADISKSIFRIKAAIAGVLDAKTKIEDACFFLEGQRPYWFNLDDEISGIWEDILKAKESLEDAWDWISGGAISNDSFKQFTGVELATVRRQIVDDILGILDDLLAPLTRVQRVADPFIQAYESLIGTIEDIKDGFEDVKRGYEKAKSLINKIFGPKIAESFPRQITDSSCGTGDYLSTTGNTLPGVDLVAEEGSEIVAPFAGIARTTGVHQVTITMDSDLKNTEIILYNVDLDSSLEGHEVNRDNHLGRVTSSGCTPNIIHFTMRSQDLHEYINPTRFFKKREMPPPGWEMHCDDYILEFDREVIAEGTITGGPKREDTSPARTTEPDTSDLDDIASSDRRKRDLVNDFFDGAKDFVDSLGLPGIDELGPVFDFNMKDMKLSQVYDFLDNAGLSLLRERLDSLLQQLKSAINNEECKRPESMDINELRTELRLRDKPTTGSRQTLIERYLETEEVCFGMRNALTENIYCTFEDHCLGVSCCMDLEFYHFHRSFEAYISYDPCNFQLKIGADKWSKTFELVDYEFVMEDTEPLVESIELLDAVQIIVKYKIEKRAGKIYVDLATGLCSSETEECFPFVTILNDAVINIPLCDEDMQTYVNSKMADSSDDSGDDLGDLSLGELEEMLDELLIDEEDVTQLMKDLRKLYQDLVKEAIDTALSGLFDDKFLGYDKCMRGAVFFQHGATFYHYTVFFMLGPIPMYFGLGCGGSYGMQYGTDICLLEMKAALIVRPQIGAQVYGYLGIWLVLLFGELRLTGYLMTVNFPTKAEVQFDHFPLDVGARMDMNLVPLRLELRALLIFELKIKIGWVKIHIRKVLINKVLWEYTTPMISGTLLDIGDLEPDLTPPTFMPIFQSPSDLFLEQQGSGGVAKKKRAIQVRDVSPNQGCIVRQLEGRDHTDPAFELSLAVEDDRSEVDMTFCVGTFKDGCDILKDQPMGGSSTIVSQMLRGGVPFYFTVTAINSAKATTKATCELPTYDSTLPGGRVTADFKSTSNPNVLKASTVALDDSVITQREEAVGFGEAVFGDQLSYWTEFDLDKNAHDIDVGDDPLGTKSLEFFAAPRLGRLKSVSHHTRHYLYAQNCAKDCLALPPTKCLSFNFDYGDSGLCELLEEIEGFEVELHESGYTYNFERLGVGHAVEFRHDDVELRHNDLHFFNLHLNNTLGYSNIISSEGILADFVPPEPGRISNAEFDEVFHETCTDYVPDEWENRCIEETPLPNHRSIIDGPGSMCVFNGHEPLQDMLYTRANQYVSANWDGFRDNETDIFGYTWTVGSTPCRDDVHPHKDPHSHLFDESEWTHIGIAHPLNLDDGAYHVSVRALNKVEFGGPLATTVCHSTEYIIDNTPPIVHDVQLTEYDEIACVITAEYDVSDPHSHIREIDFGLGKSSRDVYLLGWQRHDNTTHVRVDFCIPDGIPAWIKVRAINNVDLRTIGHSDFPIIVDTSPPTPGDVFDGPNQGMDIDYQSTSNRICANWQNFFDEQSGISKYIWGVGTAPYLDDVVSFHDVDYTESVSCRDNVVLTHTTMYYSTIFAFNAGHKKLNVSVVSDGVMFDATPPVEGELRDGLDPNVDMKYSSETATVSANWNGYSDPESGILQYDVSVYRQSADQVAVNSTEEMELIHEAQSVTPDTSSINWHHFHLHHGDTVFVELDAINQAESSTVTVSDGFVVDTTNPVVHFLGDGSIEGEDRQYSSSTSQLSANWDFTDPESGIEHYGVAVYETHGGTRRQIHPNDRNAWFQVPSTATVWTSEDNLSLKIGGHYSIRVSAVNGAGLTTVHDTNGVIIDPTTPVMRSVYVGVLAGETEELFDGFVLTTDQNGILATWSATDPESGIQAYWVAVGTTPGGTEISDYRSMGVNKDGYIDGLQLQLYDDATQQPVYYISVKAQNGAGDFSTPKISSPIKVLQGDIAGIVDDGADTDTVGSDIISVDMDYQKEDSTVTVQFHGFESQVNGIAHYEWAVGTEPRLDDVQPYTSTGIVVSDQHDNPGEGLSGSGKAQSPLTLEGGVTYYSSVRAITGAGDILDSVSDGFTVDRTSPMITINSLGVIVDNESISLDVNSAHYQESIDSLTAEWTITEDESRIQNTTFMYGSFPGASDIYDITHVTEGFSIPNGLVTPIVNGKPNILTLTSQNEVGLARQTISGSVTVDITPPVAGVVNCPAYSVAIDELSCSWSDFYDGESKIAYYELGIGTTEGDDSLFPFMKLSADTTSYRARDLQNGGLQDHGRYFTTVIAYNYVGLQARAFSSAIVVDDTPPVAGKVVELTGVDQVNVNADDGDNDGVTTCITEEECDALDVVCQKSLTQISVTWQPFTDPDTPITRYQVAAGTTPGGVQIQDFQDAAIDSYYHVFNDVDLSRVRVAYVTVIGTNAAGLTATATSNGVFISRTSQGIEPLGNNYVWDGNSDQDLDYQENNDMISGQWDFSGDPCPISKYEWSIMRFDGTVVQAMVELPDGQTYGMNDELTLSDGESYHLVVRATNVLGYSTSLRSDGVMIKLEPLLPGNVRDGDVHGFDINFQPSVTALSANWDGFGFEGLTPGDTRNREQQVISRYEVAAGTDRRYPTRRTDIHPFVDVGLNKSHTFTDLMLTPRLVTYYITVRAYSVSTAMVEQTSNGIRVGYGGRAISIGEITVPRFISSTSEMTISWSGFKFTMPIMFYQWGLGTQEDNLNTLTCNQLQNFNDQGEVNANPEYAHLFDKHDLTNVLKDTIVIPDDLDLEEGHTYTVVVIATDEAAECSLTTESFTVDTTPPEEGRLQIGAFWDSTVMYSKKTEELELSWQGYHDDISGISQHEIALYEGNSCRDITDVTLIQDFIKLSANESDYTMLDLQLQVDTPYFIHLRVTNNAGLSVTTVSAPILVDLKDPVSGTVKDGNDYKTDRMYQSTTSSMQGVFIHLPNPDVEACPGREFLTGEQPSSSDWSTVVDIGIWSVQSEEKIVFTSDKVSHSSQDGMTITMIRDVQEERMNSGAYYYTQPDITEGGKYQVEIRAAGGDVHAVTSLVMWDGPDGVVGDFDAPLGEKTWEDLVIEREMCKCCLLEEDTPIENHGNESTTPSTDLNTTETITVAFPEDCDCNCTEYLMRTSMPTNVPPTGPSVTTNDQGMIVEDGLPGKTYTGDESRKMLAQNALGLQLHSGVAIGNDIKHLAVLWSRYENDTFEPKYEIVELSFDPAEAWHTYTLQVTIDTVGSKDEWTVELFIDGIPTTYISNVYHLSIATKLVMSVWNRLDFVPDITDIFNPPSAEASFKFLRLPPSADNLCRFGDPYRNGDNAIEAFFVGVGSERLLDDVVPFRQIVNPCVPCVKPCDVFNCETSCSDTETSLFQVELNDLDLEPEQQIDDNTTVPVTYYLTVKAVTGSGRSAVMSSNGVLVDTTPPEMKELYHVDMAWSDSEPVEYQSSNTTIAVRWDGFDIGSQVKEFLWAIGTTVDGTDIQEFTSVGLEMSAQRSDLSLENMKVYFVSVKAINNAGLSTTNSTSGVTVILEAPDTTHSNTTSLCNGVRRDASIADVDFCSDQTSLGLEWQAVDEDELVDQYYFSVGTSDGKSQDVIPEIQVGYNRSGSVRIENGLLLIEDTPSANLSAMKPKDEEEERLRLENGEEDIYTNKFLMEPGRILYAGMKACNKGHRCSRYKMNKVLVKREDDEIVTAIEDEQMELKLRRDAEPHHKPSVVIATAKGQAGGTSLVAGILSDEDMEQEYTSDASVDFKPYIVNPAVTSHTTSRALRHRIHKFLDNNFYLTSLNGIPVNGKLNITVAFNMSDYQHDALPRLLYWNTELSEWHDASHTCDDTYDQYEYDLDAATLTVQVCSTTSDETTESRRKRRQTDTGQGEFTGPTSFSLAAVNINYQNTPPYITSDDTVLMHEDSGTLVFIIKAQDAEADRIDFRKTDNASLPDLRLGSANLSLDGEFTYRPCSDCYGEDTFYFVAFEHRGDGIPSLSTDGVLTVVVYPRNDYPEIFFDVNGWNLVKDNSYSLALTQEQRNQFNEGYYPIIAMVGSYDVDTEDTLTLMFEHPEHGQLEITEQQRNVAFKMSDCVMDEKTGLSTWPPEAEVTFPCDMTNPHEISRQSWVVSHVRYVPNEHYYGEDKFMVTAEDQMGARSEILVVTIHVMENKCMNGDCLGPESDPDCESSIRSQGFDQGGYGCNCTAGYAGDYCGIDFDECESNPCARNYTCIDQVDGYICYCANAKWPCAQALTTAETVGISVAVVAAVLIIIIIALVWYSRHRQKEKQKHVNGQQPSGPPMQYPRTRNLYFDRGRPEMTPRDMSTYQNPVYDATDAAIGSGGAGGIDFTTFNKQKKRDGSKESGGSKDSAYSSHPAEEKKLLGASHYQQVLPLPKSDYPTAADAGDKRVKNEYESLPSPDYD